MEQKKSKSMIWMVVVLILAIVLVGYYYISRKVPANSLDAKIIQTESAPSSIVEDDLNGF